MDTIWTTTLRTLIGFVFLLLLTRVLGKKQLSQMTFFTYITGIAMGNIAGDMVVHRDIRLVDGLVALALWSVFAIGVEWVALKSVKARVLLDGEPTILIKDGKILRGALAANRLNMDDLTMMLREKDVFEVSAVDYAILEPDGQLSVLKHAGAADVKGRLFLPRELVVDGRVVEHNLREAGLSREWLTRELRLQGVRDVEEVFFAELQGDGSVKVHQSADG